MLLSSFLQSETLGFCQHQLKVEAILANCLSKLPQIICLASKAASPMAAITGLPSPPYLIPSDGRGEARWQETGSHIPSSQRGEGGRGPMLS